MTIMIYDNKVQKSIRVHQNMDEGDIFNGCSSLSSLCEWSYQQMQTEYFIPPIIYQCFILPLIKATTTRIKGGEVEAGPTKDSTNDLELRPELLKA